MTALKINLTARKNILKHHSQLSIKNTTGRLNYKNLIVRIRFEEFITEKQSSNYLGTNDTNNNVSRVKERELI